MVFSYIYGLFTWIPYFLLCLFPPVDSIPLPSSVVCLFLFSCFFSYEPIIFITVVYKNMHTLPMATPLRKVQLSIRK